MGGKNHWSILDYIRTLPVQSIIDDNIYLVIHSLDEEEQPGIGSAISTMDLRYGRLPFCLIPVQNKTPESRRFRQQN
jgi:hypothetical protein